MFCDISDHLPVFCSVDVPVKSHAERHMIRLYNENNYHKFIEGAENCNFDAVFACGDVNEAYNLFDSKVKALHEQYFPLTRMSRTRYKSKPRITSGIRKSICRKNMLYRQYLSKPDTEHKTKLTKFRTVLSKLLQAAESQYFKNLLTTGQSSVKKMWSTINTLLNNKTKKQAPTINQIDHNNSTITDQQGIADAFKAALSKQIESRIS